MVADPICERCGRAKVWIGIGPGAEPICPQSCAPVLPGTRCPKCKSFKIEPFYFVTMFGIPVKSDNTMHCIDCGKVFDKKDAL